MSQTVMGAAVVIPSLEPDGRLVPYAKELTRAGYAVVAVNDGSGERYNGVFNALGQLSGVTVLTHEVNQGKGEALKTAYRHILSSMSHINRIITADADGQHTPGDVAKLDAQLPCGERVILMGTRDFSLPHVPWKSRMGNRITSFIFKHLYGVCCRDTQTGLRAFSRDLLPFMAQVSGSRFEYEMNVLIEAAMDKIPLRPVPIETVYENENEGSHFHPMRDSIRIYKVIFGNFFRFVSTSLITAGIDMLIYNVLYDVLENAGLTPDTLRITLGKTIARILSATANFVMNKNLVFKLKSNGRKAALRYGALCVLILSISVGTVSLLKGLGVNEHLSSPFVDIMLFLLSYRAQRGWVFKEEEQ